MSASEPTSAERRERRHGAGLDRRRGVFMISVAAELAEMHPQTLRMYEARGLITPKRSPKNTRLYSYEDVERLRRIQQMTAEEGLNLAGVETVLDARARARARPRGGGADARARRRARAPDGRRARAGADARCAAELVPYGAYETGLGTTRRRVASGSRSRRSSASRLRVAVAG